MPQVTQRITDIQISHCAPPPLPLPAQWAKMARRGGATKPGRSARPPGSTSMPTSVSLWWPPRDLDPKKCRFLLASLLDHPKKGQLQNTHKPSWTAFLGRLKRNTFPKNPPSPHTPPRGNSPAGTELARATAGCLRMACSLGDIQVPA